MGASATGGVFPRMAIDLLVGGLLLRRLTGRLGRSDQTPDRPVDVLLAGLAR